MQKKRKSSVTKKNIAAKLYKKFGCALNQRLIQDAVNTICTTIQENLLQDQAISVDNFGTLSPYLFHQHSGLNIATGKIEKVKAFRTIKFRPHFTLLQLLSQRRERFLGKQST